MKKLFKYYFVFSFLLIQMSCSGQKDNVSSSSSVGVVTMKADASTIVYKNTTRLIPFTIDNLISQPTIKVLKISDVSKLSFANVSASCIYTNNICTGFIEVTPETDVLGKVDVIFNVNDGDLSYFQSLTFSFEEEILPLYSAAQNWNNFLSHNPAKPVYEQENMPCDITYFNNPKCFHAGEHKKIKAINYSTCENLSMVDELGFFDWTCIEGQDAPYFYNQFKKGKSLKDLLNSSSWKLNRVHLKENGSTVYSSALSEWWGNIVEPLPDNQLSTDPVANLEPGKVYTLDSSRATSGYYVGSYADRVTVVIFEGQTLKYSGNPNKYCDVNWAIGSVNDPTWSATCLFAVKYSDYFWLEGHIDGEGGATDSEYGVKFYSSMYANFKNFKMTNFSSKAVSTRSVAHFFFKDGVVANNNRGINLSQYGGYHFENINFFNNSSGALSISTYNTGSGGPYPGTSLNNIISANNGNYGISVLSTNYTYFNASNITVINNIGDGLIVDNPEMLKANLNNIYAANNSGFGINLSMINNEGHFHNIASLNNGLQGLRAEFVSSEFKGALLLGNNNASGDGSDCEVITSSSNLVHSTCSTDGNDGDLLANGGAVLRRGLTSANSIVGEVTNDSVNLIENASGAALYTAITEFNWISFENIFRFWGKYDAAVDFPHANFQGKCLSGSFCQIWDASLKSTDTILLNKTKDGLNANTPLVNGAPCPDELSGSNTLTDNNAVITPSTYLVHATEFNQDMSGDNDGLCESNEECFYTPNFGAYQGHGDLLSNYCVFSDGLGVQNAKIYFYPQNGR